MKRARRQTALRSRWQRGVAALEMALILPFILVLLPYPVLLGRAFWHYTMLQKAAYDAARYLSTAPAMDMKSVSSGQNYPAELARNMVAAATADINSELEPVFIVVQCDGDPCGSIPLGKLPSQIRVSVAKGIRDDWFPDITSALIGDGLALKADIKMPYIYVAKPIN
jgi:hypothetical protein